MPFGDDTTCVGLAAQCFERLKTLGLVVERYEMPAQVRRWLAIEGTVEIERLLAGY